MTKFVKKFWKWNERYNNTEFKLGNSIETLLKKNLISSSDDPNEYIGKNDLPWRIRTNGGIIKSIFYREVFTGFLKEDFWHLEINELEPRLNEILEPTDGNHQGDVLTVAFRGGFVAVAGIYRQSLLK